MHHFTSTAFAAVLATGLAAQGAIVSPADRVNLEGSSFTHFPLGRFNARVQQLHADVPGGTVITGHAYRRDAEQVHGHVDAFSAEIEVTLSMSPNTPAHASATFANNAGPSPVVTLPRTRLNFPATDRPALDPSPTFDLLVPYAVPFVMPPGGGTLCIDSVLFTNTSPAGIDRNLSIYLDAHQLYSDGRAEQPGFRMLQGCAAPGATATAFGTTTFWRLATSTQIDVGIRNGVPDPGTGSTRPFVALGINQRNLPWPSRPSCLLLTSTETWFPLPGSNDTGGSYDGSLAGLPLLPPGYRLYLQTGSIDLGSGGLAFGDVEAMITPPTGPVPVTAARIVSQSDRTAPTGAVSLAVPVTRFL
ncbi:MAG TPA: hypothetical protein VK348_02745 [Planctomycetota bacterium]|nr:hypothetical protein [Planctomycetota bacterium]